MNYDDIIYVILLLISIASGIVYRQLSSPFLKRWFGTILGFIVIFIPSGFHIIHPLLITLFVIALLKYGNRSHCHSISFACLFAYLLFFRLCHYIGLPPPPPHTNAIHMMITLKLVGVCLELHENFQKACQMKKTEDEDVKKKLELELKYEKIEPTSVDIFHYAFSYIGILTGPYYRYRIYQDLLNDSMPLAEKNQLCFEHFKKRIRVLPLYVALFILSSMIFPLSFAKSEEIFRDYSFLYRVWYMTPLFFTFRMRIYSGFILSECVCIMAGLGAYPVGSKPSPGKGPNDYGALELRSKDTTEYNFETIHNIDEWNSDFAPTVRGGMRAWNMTVQYWLVANVYKRLKFNKPIKEALTMLTSAFWHGVHSGYYLSMLTVPFIIAVEDYYERLIRRRLSQQSQKVYDFVNLFLKMQFFSYMGVAFLLLSVKDTLSYWNSVGFLYHGCIAMLHGVAQFVNLILGKAEKKLKKARETTVIGDSRVRVVKTIGAEDKKTK